ncbi:MAG TPA: NAD(P)/FAD-dependent oxidoreductase, partial [Acidimicrobiales bacterium]|nr:NAD(P)/FAD-dependent oxidoreductase [Acidimicrobiales bacterium]
DREELGAAVRTAYLPALLTALAHALGDLSLLRDDLRPDPERLQLPSAGLGREQRAAARELAIDCLQVLGDGGGEPPAADEAVLRQLVSFVIGEPVSDEYFELLTEELGVGPHDARTPAWHKRELDATRPFSAVIVGAGMSGLVAAHRFAEAGLPFTVIEKNADVGGTWFENRYPGCRVDVPNHLYSYSFFKRNDWPQRFTPQEKLLDYFRDAADAFDIRKHIRFDTEVIRARYDDATNEWRVTVRSGDGVDETLYANVLVSAVGQLNRPRLPDIVGRDSFRGASFHSARWDHTVDLRNARVAVIGTAASGIQLIPALAGEVAELHVYQRTPNWFMPTPDYHADTPAPMQWLLDHVPTYHEWYRLSLFWRLSEGMLASARVDPEWSGHPGSVSAQNDALRMLLTQYLEAQFADTPELLTRLVPDYPPLAKRILLDNGVWASTLKQDHVELVTDAIQEITPTGVVAGDRERGVDAIVYATGFRASEFLTPLRVEGRGGRDLHESWNGDARAYLGITVPDFPNLFFLYGPNTNLVANGSIIYFSECAVQYILSGVRQLLERRANAVDCKPAVHAEYNTGIDAANRMMAWGHASVNTWYRNAAGRIAQNWPYTLLEYWRRTRELDLADYELL